MKNSLRSTLLLLLFAATAATAAPTVPPEAKQPGTQPNQVPEYTSPDNCQACHGGTVNPDLEPSFGWRGSMMAHASRDPLFWAALAVAEQDFLPDPDPALRGGAGDVCLRCHMPNGWLAGRSTPTDGSAMDAAKDANGIECEHCHKLVDPDQPVNIAGTVEQQTTPFEAYDSTTGDGYYGTAQYVINNEGSRLGPYGNPAAAHPWKASTFIREGEFCGTCHDVSNPAVGDLAHNNGRLSGTLPPGSFSGSPGGSFTAKAAFNNEPHSYGVVERTFSEWKASALDTWAVNDFGLLPAELQVAGGSLHQAWDRAYSARSDANYEDGTVRRFTCQTCHMSASTGVGCRQGGVPTRTDLPRHDLTGGGYWVPDLILYQEDEGQLRFGSGLTTLQRDALAAGKLRAGAMLESAASLGGSVLGNTLTVRTTNLTGHKLISGYPEGRRMWLNVRWLDAGDALIEEDGAYGPIGRTVDDLGGATHAVESLIDPDTTRLFHVIPGMDQQWAAQLLGLGYASSFPVSYDRMTDAVDHTLGQLAAESPGTAYHSSHFILNNFVIADTRIPPYGFDYDEALERQTLPVPASQYGNPGAGGAYLHWDDAAFTVPVGAVTAEVRLYFQQASWEYVQFLWLANDGLNTFLGQEGDNLLDAWLNTGQSPPYEMALISVDVSAAVGVPGEASEPGLPARQMIAAYDNGTGEVLVDYTPACDATDHTIYFGDLASVATQTLSGAVCGVGVGGSAAFDPGMDDAFFLIVGNNGSSEGSYGRDGAGAERPEDVGTAACDISQDLAAVCTP
ncbi:MAG: hypothetical protein GY716_19710 [bacterium]|nr:hypothetical protein [bacterium]